MRNAFPILVGLSLVIAAGFAAASAQDAGPDLDLAEIRARAAEHAADAEALATSVKKKRMPSQKTRAPLSKRLSTIAQPMPRLRRRPRMPGRSISMA